MSRKLLEVQFSGWTATPRMPFILSGNALCLHTPSYSLLLGLIGCCLGRIVTLNEVNIGFRYSYDSIGTDLETRQRLEFNGKKIKAHAKGSDAYNREFHTSPKLTIWINRLDWKTFFESPIGTPSLGRSQDILKIEHVREVEVENAEKGALGGSLLPFTEGLQAGGQLVQLAEAFKENEDIGAGRTATDSKIFISIPHDNLTEIECDNIFKTIEENPQTFFFYEFDN